MRTLAIETVAQRNDMLTAAKPQVKPLVIDTAPQQTQP